MRIDDLIDSLFKDVVKPPSVDANSPGEMVRAQLAGQMPGQVATPRPIAGAPVAPVARSPLPAPMGAGVASSAPAASPAPAPLRLNPLGSLARGYSSGGLIGGIANMFDEPTLLERQQQEKARTEQQALAQQNQTVDFLVAKHGLSPAGAAVIARQPDLLKEYLKPREAPKPIVVNDRLVNPENGQVIADFSTTSTKPPQVETFYDEKTGQEVKRQFIDGRWENVGGVKQAGPDAATSTIKTEAARADIAFNNLIPAIDDYVKTVEKTGAEFLPGQNKDEIGQKLRNIQLQLKEAYNLGVLNGPDLALMEQMLFDPRIGLNPFEWTNAYNAPERTKQSAENLKKIIMDMRNNKVAQTGGAPVALPGGGSGPQPGTVEDGHRFKGGNPADPNNWEKVQ